MNGNSQLTSYICQDDIFWTKDVGQTVLVSESQHRTFILHGLEEAIWSWLTLGYQHSQLQHQVGLSLHVADSVAKTVLLQVLDEWVDKGILRKDDDYGES